MNVPSHDVAKLAASINNKKEGLRQLKERDFEDDNGSTQSVKEDIQKMISGLSVLTSV